MAESGTGIQELMAAETRASQIVAEARIGKHSKERRIGIPAGFEKIAVGRSIVHENCLSGLTVIRHLLLLTPCVPFSIQDVVTA